MNSAYTSVYTLLDRTLFFSDRHEPCPRIIFSPHRNCRVVGDCGAVDWPAGHRRRTGAVGCSRFTGHEPARDDCPAGRAGSFGARRAGAPRPAPAIAGAASAPGCSDACNGAATGHDGFPASDGRPASCRPTIRNARAAAADAAAGPATDAAAGTAAGAARIASRVTGTDRADRALPGFAAGPDADRGHLPAGRSRGDHLDPGFAKRQALRAGTRSSAATAALG